MTVREKVLLKTHVALQLKTGEVFDERRRGKKRSLELTFPQAGERPIPCYSRKVTFSVVIFEKRCCGEEKGKRYASLSLL